MPDELFEEVARYRELYRDCTAEQILQVMGEMRDFFFGRMTQEEYGRYERLREAMNEKVQQPVANKV